MGKQRRQFSAAFKDDAKLEGVTFHTLRHACASHLAMAGADLASIKEILRHKSIDMTMRYAHLAPAHKKAAMKALETSLANVNEGEEKSKTA